MKKIFIFIGLFIILGIVVVNALLTRSSSKDTAIDKSEVKEEVPTFDALLYYGDSLSTFDGITYYADYRDAYYNDVSFVDGTCIVAMRGAMPVDTFYIEGEYNLLRGCGSTLEISTSSYPINSEIVVSLTDL